MANVQELQTAIGEMLVARRNAAYRKRDAGDPRNPFQAKIGLEREFYEASQSVRTYDLILKLLENETKREALKRMRPARVKITKAVDRMVDIADRDMTKAELAAEVSVAPQYLSYILNGTRSGGKYLPAIVAALELDPGKVEKAIAA